MGTLTLDDFRNDLRLTCGGISATSPVWTEARLNQRINASYLWVSMPNHFRHPELEEMWILTLLANTAAYDLIYIITAPNCYMITGVEHVESAVVVDPAGHPVPASDETRRTKLDPIGHRELMSIQRSSSKPTCYAYWNEQIIIDCVPAVAYQGQALEVHGYRQPATLTLDGSVTLLKPEWDEVILLGAEWRVWLALNEADRAHEAKQNYGAMVNEIADIRKLHGEEWGWQTGGNMNTYMRNG